MIGIIDYGMVNTGSILNMLKKIGVDQVRVVEEAKQLEDLTKIILPGVGAFDAAMEAINQRNLARPLRELVMEQKTPILGICLGMQILGKASEEGTLEGLGLVDAVCKKLPSHLCEKVPHMGWNYAKEIKPSALTPKAKELRFYHVHSYYMECKDPSDILFQANYGLDFTTGIEKENIVAVQFHPEKSHQNGMELLENFVKRFAQ